MQMRKMNPILPPDWYIPDGEAHVIGDYLYLYGSKDQSKDHYCSTDYYVARTKDFAEWEIKGPSFQSHMAKWAKKSKKHSSVSGVKCFEDLPDHIKNYLPESARQIPVEDIIKSIEAAADKSLSDEVLLYAPDAIERDGTTYLYMCLSDDSVGVAKATSPQGPFYNAKQVINDKSKMPIEGIDPGVFIDDDGCAYLYWGQFNAKAAKLSKDMSEVIEETFVEGILTEKEHHFHEGSSMRKRGETYYYVFADTSRGKATTLAYATSKSPLGPFIYQGVIIDNVSCDPKSWNNHGSIEVVNGQWYVFYHRSCNNSEYFRRACAEKIAFDDNGLIKEVKMTSQGVGDPFEVDEIIPAYCACELFGSAYVSNYEAGNTLIVDGPSGGAVYRYIKAKQAAQKICLEGSGDATIEVWIDKRKIGQGLLFDNYIEVEMPEGLHELCIIARDAKAVRIQSICIEG